MKGAIAVRGEEREDRVAARRDRPRASAWSTSTSCWWTPSPSPRTSSWAGGRPDPGPATRPRRRSRSSRTPTGSRSTLGAIVEDLSVGEEQRVEILKALYRGVEILILDEPTAVLTPAESAGPVRQPARAARRRASPIVFISHKLDEVLEIADRITVLRRGAVVGETTPAETSKAKLAEMMVGRPVLFRLDKPKVEIGATGPADARRATAAGCRGCSLRGARGRDRRRRGGRGQRSARARRRDHGPAHRWTPGTIALRRTDLAGAGHRGDPERRGRLHPGGSPRAGARARHDALGERRAGPPRRCRVLRSRRRAVHPEDQGARGAAREGVRRPRAEHRRHGAARSPAATSRS